MHFNQYRIVFVVTMLFSGSTYISALLLSSKLFAAEIFCSGLTKYELRKLSKLKMFGAVLAENFPQLIIQILYAVYKSDVPSIIFIMSFVSSLLSIVSAVLQYFMQRRSSNYTVVQYRVKIIKINALNLLKHEQRKTLQKKECHKELRISLCTALNIDDHSLEFGKVTILNNGVSVKVIHYVFADDLGNRSHTTMIGYLYNMHKQEVDNALSAHFGFDGTSTVNAMNIVSQEMQSIKHFNDSYVALND
eukprot:100435_1